MSEWLRRIRRAFFRTPGELSIESSDALNSAMLAAIVVSSDDAIVGKTLDGVITSWNLGAERIFGYTAEEAIGQDIRLIIPLDRRSEEDEVLARLRRGEKVDHFETVRRRKDGRLVHVSLTVSPIKDRQGRIVGASKVARDITERKIAGEMVAASQRRYHRIFDLAGVSMWEEDFSSVRLAMDALRARGVQDFRAYFTGHPDEVERFIRLVRVIDVNETTIEMFGATDKSMLLGSLETIFDASSRQVFIDELVALAEERGRFESEAVLRTLGGERLDVLVSITFPPASEPTETVLVSLTDITIQKQVEQARRESEALFREMAEIRDTLSRVGAALASKLDPETLVQSAVDASMALTSAQFAAFVYESGDQSEHPQHRVALAGSPRDAFASLPTSAARGLVEGTLRGRARVRLDDLPTDPRYDGSSSATDPDVVTRSFLAVPVISRTGDVWGGLFFGHTRPRVFLQKHEQLAAGIAAWASLALDNARLYKEAQEANRIKDEFMATLSHELRTPLNAMLGWSHLLKSGALSPDTERRALDTLERNVRAQAQLVDDLLDVSRIVAGKLQMTTEEVDLSSIVVTAADTVRPAAAAKHLLLRVLVDQDTEVVVMGDSDRLRQVLWNLLTNAVKFTPQGGRVDIELRHTESAALVIVSDTGQGIRPDFLRHVFERFRQADSSASRRHGGLGLGLTIVRHLIEAHGGSVSVESEGEGQGASFTVTLPLHLVRNRVFVPADESPGHGTQLASVRVLLVDDEADTREVVRVMLEMQGASVSLASSSGEALELLTRQSVDVLLADIGMPDRDGYSLIEGVRSLDLPAAATPAVAVTAYVGSRDRTRAFSAGYNWHLAKPVDPEQLIAVVAAAARARPQTTSTIQS